MPARSATQAPGKLPLDMIHIFNAMPGANVLLSPDLYIQAVSDAYLAATLTKRENLLGRYLFDAFPDNPEAPDARAVHNLKASLEQVLATRQPHQMQKQHYDVPDQANPNQFIERHWLPHNTPVLDAKGNVTHIIHTVVNVTDSVKAKSQLQESQAREAQAYAEVAEKELARKQLELSEAKLLQLNKQLQDANNSLKAAALVAEEAKQTVERERSLLQSVLNHAPVAIGLFQGEEQVVLSANDQLCKVWGYKPEQVLGKPILEAVPELSGQGFAEQMAEVARTLEPFSGTEIPAKLHHNGKLETFYFNFVFQPLHDTAGNLLGVLSISIDVTPQVLARQEVQALNNELEARVVARTVEVQRAQAEAELQRQRLERLFMQAPAAICILNGPDLVYELVNPAYKQLFPERELLGKPILEVLPEIAHNKVYHTFREVYDTGKTHEEGEFLIPIARADDGVLEERYFNYIQQARYDERGIIDGVLVFAYEVTAQVEARKASETSAKNLRLITDALPVLIGYLDKEEKYRFANKAYEPWFNLQPEDLLGRTVKEVLGEKAYLGVKQYITRALSGERLDFEAEMPYRDDFKKYIRTSYVPDIRNGEVVGFFTLVNDITERIKAQLAVEESEQQAKALAKELAEANEHLRMANEEISNTNRELGFTNKQLTRINSDLDNFVYTASHDLKAPILNIEGLMGALLEELQVDSIKSFSVKKIADMILDSVQRFKRTIEHLTEITKLQKEHEFTSLPVNVAAVIEDVKLDLAPAIKASHAQIDVDVDRCPEIEFSEKNFRSIIYNLLSNAIKYKSPQRMPLIQISCEATAEYDVLTVQDNGLGMDLKNQQKLFAMFQRLHNHVEGSGIGLFMVKRIIDNAGGKIEVQSRIDEGSVFQVFFRRSGK